MLTEADIFDALIENFRKAAEYARKLAAEPATGKNYDALRKHLKLAEGACRQAGYWRDDARWFNMGLYMEEAHKRAGSWLRGIKQVNDKGEVVKTYPPRWLFNKLADNMDAGMRSVQKLKDDRTHRVGMILPVPKKAPLRTNGRPVSVPELPAGMTKRKSGLVIPDTIH